MKQKKDFIINGKLKRYIGYNDKKVDPFILKKMKDAFVVGCDYINRKHTYGGMSFALHEFMPDNLDETILRIYKSDNDYYSELAKPFFLSYKKLKELLDG